MATRPMEPCSVCGELTEWRCADCAIGRIHESHPVAKEWKQVAVCANPACRDAHEQAERANHASTRPTRQEGAEP